MIKCWRRLCFLVLAVSSLSRGENNAIGPPNDDTKETSATVSPGDARIAANSPTPPTPSLQSNALGNGTELIQETSSTGVDHNDTLNTTKDNSGSAAAQTTASAGVAESWTKDADIKTTVFTATTSTSSKLVPIEGKNISSWGYVVLILIIMVIIVLSVILYLLRRVSRSYSFDLQRPVPASHLNEPTGTFGQVYLDDLDPSTAKDQESTEELSPEPVANGTTLQTEERNSNGENAQQEQSDANGLEASPTSNTSPSLGDEQADNTSTNSVNLFFDAFREEQQNENNNNPSVCSSDPFVEINLDEPAWCDQLLSSPEASSSVLPFSPFSFSSSSS
uniref:uncharacterized protein n=1 Tax=Semicossyphus pulcher TaxID=241346 RepID=UPI0037E8B160